MKARIAGISVEKALRYCFAALFSAAAFCASAADQSQPIPGFTDTPFLPGNKWRVHDPARPQPPVVAPGTASSQERPGRPPSDAIVLFDGTDLSQWRDRDGRTPPWRVENGELTVGKGTIYSRQEFGDVQLHVEFCTPTDVGTNTSQARGNSGVFLMDRYEFQILDSYENPTYADGMVGAIYGQYPPLVNAARPPGEWQTYDIVFIAPRFEDGKLKSPAYATVFLNGVLVQHHAEILGSTQHRRLASYTPHPPTGPISLQDHGTPNRFRNIWVRPLKLEE